MMKIKTSVAPLLLGLLLCFNIGLAQDDPNKGITQIEKWIKADSLVEAQQLLDNKLAHFRNTKNYDSLVSYVEIVGSYALANDDKKQAYLKAKRFVEELKASDDPVIISLALQNLGYVHSGTGDPLDTYNIYLEAQNFAMRSNDPQKAQLAGIQNKLGYEAQNIGDFQLAKKHYLKAVSILDGWESTDVEFYQQNFNSLGIMMWMESKLDSCSYYFNRSLEALSRADTTDYMNSLFRPALVKMNLSVLNNALGNNDKAISLTEESVNGFSEFIRLSNDEFRIFGARKHRATAIENLGSYYHTQGEFKKADALITYANAEKRKFMDSISSSLIISRVVLAQAKMGIRDFESAKTLLEESLQILKDNPGIENYWEAGALTTLGTVYENLGDKDQAANYYDLGSKAFKNTLQGAYNKDFLDELIEISIFYSTSGYPQKGLEIALEIYNEARKGDFRNTLQDFKHTVNLASVYYQLKNYENAIKYAQEALDFKFGGENEASGNLIIEYRKPKALHILISSQYALNQKLTVPQLKAYLEQIEEGFEVLEIRKASLKNFDDVSLFIEENTQLFELAKKIRLDLYQLTLEEEYLDDIISLHESAMYSRIRSRLNFRSESISSKIPKDIANRERNLKNTLNLAINNEATNSIETFFETTGEWNQFIDSLKINYPEYYELKYATLEESAKDLQEFLDEETTLVRYLFIEEQLYVLVISKRERSLYPIEFDSVRRLIKEVTSQEFDVEKIAPKLHQLYQSLWQPFEQKISTKNVVIVPDRELFNLSFEMLTPKPLTSFSEISTNSLLTKYNISYQFSLLVMNPKQNVVNTFDSNYVAFAPEFSDSMKEQYLMQVKDSTNLDRAYLNLLPQPFSVDVIEKYSKLFGGDSFLNENASKQLFEKSAGEHKIIHIGTHAESDNISPELSRLVFAKNPSVEDINDNYLYTYEIYNYDLSSNLAILTACETGKPGYQAGEGMISLAHAFTYAGSESILTSLWEIDEESSSKILNFFYDNLSEGMAKDVALREAKLEYIATAKGRTASPQYWAGLVLIGDTAPIELQSTHNLLYWILGAVFLVLFILWYFKFRK